jgi:hypothetical protein
MWGNVSRDCIRGVYQFPYEHNNEPAAILAKLSDMDEEGV